MLFEKWYMDIQNNYSTGYCYIGRLKIGGISIPFSEVHLHHAEKIINEYKTGFKYRSGFQSVSSGHYEMQLEKKDINLVIRYNDGELRGSWKRCYDPLPQPIKPIFKDVNGICDWKICSPKSKVSLNGRGNHTFEITGQGYIDYVRLTIPLWKIPFKTLCWGRLFSDDDWFCFFHLTLPDSKIGFIADKSGWIKDVSVNLKKNTEGEVKQFDWFSGLVNFSCDVKKCLHQGPVLDSKRTGWLPTSWRNRISCNAFEKKYQVKSFFHQKHYSGIMEEVNWNGTQHNMLVS